MGKDTHALSRPAEPRRSRCSPPTASRRSSSATDGFTPTPVISRAILALNRRPHGGAGRRHRHHAVAQPAEDGGFKYNPPNGGPADTDVTGWIQDRANELLEGGNEGVAATRPTA